MRPIKSLFLAALLGASGLHAAVYDVGGNSLAFSSIAAAFVSVTADAPFLPASETITVLVHGGAYSGSGSIPSLSQPLVISASVGTLPLISGGGSFGISISGVANLLIQGLTIQGFSQAGISLQNCPGAMIVQNSLKNNSTEMLLKACPSAFISGNALQPSGTGLLMQDSPNSTLRYNSASGFSGSYSLGLTLTNSASALITHNSIKDAINGIALISCNAVTISANAVVSRLGSPVQGISLDSSLGCWIFNNLVVGQQNGIHLQGSNNAGLANNTVWDHIQRGLHAASSSGLLLRNNIIGGDTALFLDAASLAALDSQYNDLVGQTQLAEGGSFVYSDLGAWQGSGNDTSLSLSADPLFANAAGSQASDFVLQPGSPVQGHGLDLSALFSSDYFDDLRFSGAWDLGFYSLNSGSPTPTPTATISPVVPSPTPTFTATASPTPANSPMPSATPTISATKSPTPTVTPTFSPTSYPVKKDRLVSYPNPYNPSLGIPLNFVYEASDDVTLRIFDIAGGLIAEIPAASIKNSQGYAAWDGRSQSGAMLPAGLYLAVLRSSKGSHFTRFTVVY